MKRNKALLETLIHQLVNEEIRKKMHIDLPPDLLEISQIFKAAGRQLFLVGGSVRDALLGKSPKDYDVASDATPDQIIEIFRSYPKFKIIEIGKAFGVIKILSPEGGEYEVATFRQDLSGGRRPDAVAFTTIDKDVERRDLTINALFYDIEKQEVVDYVGGIQDLEQGVVRTVGNPVDRFNEDRLRILRALRFAARMGSRLDPETDKAIKADNSLYGVSGERIRDEFIKGIVGAKDTTYFLRMVQEYDLWDQIFPGMSVNHNYVGIKSIPVQIALLLRDNDPRTLPTQLNKLKYSATEVAQISFLAVLKSLTPENAFRMHKLFKNSHLKSEDLLEFAKSAGAPDLKLLKAFVSYEPSVTGTELQAQGLTGKALGDEMQRRETENFRKLLGQ